MPKGSELYSDLSRRLLRAARMPWIPGQPAKPMEDEKELGDEEDAEGELDTGFTAMRWSQVPRESEQPEPEFLAKRRKGLPSIYGVTTGTAGRMGMMRKTKVKRVDNEGNTVFLDVLVPEGTVVEGEVAEGDETLTEAPAPGTVVEGVGIANAEGVIVAGEALPTPPRRRPPPPKRKPKGPGRGRKKKVVVENGPGGVPTISNADGPKVETMEPNTSGLQVPGNPPDKIVSTDIDIGDGSVLQDGEEGSEEDDDEGEEGEDGDREEGELSEAHESISRSASPAKSKPGAVGPSIATFPTVETPSITEASNRDPSSSPDVPLAAGQIQQAPTIVVEQVSDTLTATTAVVFPNPLPFSQGSTVVTSTASGLDRTQEADTRPIISQPPATGSDIDSSQTSAIMSIHNGQAMAAPLEPDLSSHTKTTQRSGPGPVSTASANGTIGITPKDPMDASLQSYVEPAGQASFQMNSSQMPVGYAAANLEHVSEDDVSSLQTPSVPSKPSAAILSDSTSHSSELSPERMTGDVPETDESSDIPTKEKGHLDTSRIEADDSVDILGSLAEHLNSKSA